jgi:hypothetical protein
MKSPAWPVACLLMSSPLIGEYLLGSLPASMLALLPLMMAMYGAGAVLIREFARARDRGWASIVLLAAAYGLFEEGFVTQSLFNPNYLHLRLLDFGFLPALGTALPWAVFVVGIHVVWSITVPIALTESAFPAQRERPWLGTGGRAALAAVFMIGAALVAVFGYRQVPFVASAQQFAVTGGLIVALCVTASKLPRRRAVEAGTVPHPIVLFLASFTAGSVFMLVSRRAESAWHLGWGAALGLSLATVGLFVGLVLTWTRHGRWSESRRFALMAGAFMVYVWIGFQTDLSLHGSQDLIGHSVIAAVLVAMLAAAGWRASRNDLHAT